MPYHTHVYGPIQKNRAKLVYEVGTHHADRISVIKLCLIPFTRRLLQNFSALLYCAPVGCPVPSKGVNTHLNTLPCDPCPCSRASQVFLWHSPLTSVQLTCICRSASISCVLWCVYTVVRLCPCLYLSAIFRHLVDCNGVSSDLYRAAADSRTVVAYHYTPAGYQYASMCLQCFACCDFLASFKVSEMSLESLTTRTCNLPWSM